MLHIDVQQDEILQENLNRIISGVLPHQNYEPSLFIDLTESIFKLINLEEFSGEYYALMSTIKSIGDIKLTIRNYTPKLTRESLDGILQANIIDLVRSPYTRIYDILTLEGLDTNLDLPETLNRASSLLYTRTMELYDTCMTLAKDSNESLTFIPALKGAFIYHTAEMSLRLQSQILNGSVLLGRKTYAGAKDWMQFLNDLNLEINRRISDNGEGVLYLDSIEKSNKLMEESKASSIPLGNYGLPPIDGGTPMLRHRLVVVSARENTGKTKFMVNCGVNLFRNKHKVAIMCGETTFAKMHSQLISNYVYKEYGTRLSNKEIDKVDELPDDIRRQVNIARTRIVEEQNFILFESFKYQDLYAQLVNHYERKPFDALFIDHSYALKGSGDAYTNQSMLAIALREFKNNYPVYIQILTHLSSDAKEQILKGKQVESSPTKGNAALSTEADEVFILYDNENLRKQGLLAIQNYKRRDEDVIITPMVVRKQFDVSAFHWDEKLQNNMNPQAIQMDKLLDAYAEDDLDDDDEDLGFGDDDWE